MAKFWSFDVGKVVDISLESEGEIKMKTLEDFWGKGSSFFFNKYFFHL